MRFNPEKLTNLKHFAQGALMAVALIGAGYLLAQLPLWAVLVLLFIALTCLFAWVLQ